MLRATDKGEIEKGSLRGCDLLSLMVKVIMTTDLPKSQRMSDKIVLVRVHSSSVPLRRQ